MTHRAGQLGCRRSHFDVSVRGRGAPLVLPSYSPITPWVHGDMPILIAAIDPSTRNVIDWAIQEFDRPPAHVAELRAV